jgi:uncharacterized membrane protein YczE
VEQKRVTESSRQALEILRSPDHFSWGLIPLLAFVIYVYTVEAQKKNWHMILAGLILYAAELAWEMFNALVLTFTDHAPLWSAPGDTAYLILVGLNVEISMMFLVSGVIVCKSLPKEKNAKVLGLPNRLVIPLMWGLFCVFVEVLLNRAGALVWDWPFWNWPNIYLIVVAYSATFYLTVWVYDHLSLRVKTTTFAIIVATDLLAWILLVPVLGWI